MNKFLTVIVRVYNREKSIINCLNSILSQTAINDIQILVINDCSTDNSLNVINKIKEDNPNVCIDIVSHEKNMGRGKGLNTAKKYITGKWCQLLDSDDIWTNDNHVQELKDKLENTDYKMVCWYCGNLHVYNVYLSELFKECHINNINYFEDHYSTAIYNECIGHILIMPNNYYKIHKESEDRENKQYCYLEKFFHWGLFHLYEDVFYYRYKKDDLELKKRCDEFPVHELDDVLLESYNEIKQELIDNPFVPKDPNIKYNLISKTLGIKINKIYSVVKIPNINLIVQQSLSFNEKKDILEYKDCKEINSKYNINIDNIKNYRPEQAICILQDPVKRLFNIYHDLYKETYNNFDEFIIYVKELFDTNKIQENVKQQYNFFNLYSIDEFIMIEDYIDWCKEHNIQILDNNTSNVFEEFSESSINIIKELYKDDYELIDIIKNELNKLYKN